MKAKINEKEVSFKFTLEQAEKTRVAGLDLGDLENGPLVSMFANPALMGSVVWAAYDDRIKEAGVSSREEFFALVDGKTLAEITNATREGLKDFFPLWKEMAIAIDNHLKMQMKAFQERVDQSLPSGPSSGTTLG